MGQAIGNAIGRGVQNFFTGFVGIYVIEQFGAILEILNYHVYVNGRQIFFNKNSIEKCQQMLKELSGSFFGKNKKEERKEDEKEEEMKDLVKKIFGELIPDDTILLDEDEINEYFKNFMTNQRNKAFPVFIFYSHKIYEKKNRKSNSFQYSDYKILEKNEKFIIVEYPQKKEKFFVSIVIMGNKKANIKFINGFLNYLYDIKEEDNIRLKLETKENDDFIEEIFVSSKKGNFKFNCIDFEKDLISKENIRRFLDFAKEEKNMNLIVFNKNELITILKEKDFANIFSGEDQSREYIFFASPNIIYNIFQNYLFKLKFNILKNAQNSSKENLQDINEKYEAISFFCDRFLSYYFDYECIYDKSKNKKVKFLYNITMEGYSNFFEICNKKKFSLNFSLLQDIKNIKINYEKNIDKIDLCHKYKDYYENFKKQIKENNAQINGLEYEIKRIKNQINQINEQKTKSDIQIQEINQEIKALYEFKKQIDKDNSFYFPVNFDKKTIDNKRGETNVCQVCKFNCHINCDEYIKKFCKCYKIYLSGFQCQECPNKCYSDKHEVVKYQYPKYIYKNIDEILRQYTNVNSVSPSSKCKFVIDKKEEKIKELKKTLEINIKPYQEEIDKKEEKLKKIEEERNKIQIKLNKIEKIYQRIKNKVEEEIKDFQNKLDKKLEDSPFYEILIARIMIGKKNNSEETSF